MKTIICKTVPAVLVIAVCLAGCAATGRIEPGREASPEFVEDGVVFRYYDPDASKVFLVGDFNHWSPASDPMKDLNDDGHWSLFYPLDPGSYQYKFIVDGRWIPDPLNPRSEPDGFGDINSVVTVPPQ